MDPIILLLMTALAEPLTIIPSNSPSLPVVESKIASVPVAALVAAAEREACADIGDRMDPLQDGAIGRAIRARGETK